MSKIMKIIQQIIGQTIIRKSPLHKVKKVHLQYFKYISLYKIYLVKHHILLTTSSTIFENVKSKVISRKTTAMVRSSIISVEPEKILNSIVDVVFAMDEKGIFWYVSPSSTQLVGFTPEEMEGTSFQEYIHAQDLDKTTQKLDVIKDYNSSTTLDSLFSHKDGRFIPVHLSVRWIEDDQLFYCVARNGAEKWGMQQRLQKAQQIAKVANFEYDVVNKRYTYASDTLFDIFGIDKKKHTQFTPDLFWSLIHPDDIELLKKNILLPDHLYNSKVEYRVIRPDGKLIYINRIREVIRDGKGNPVKTIGTIQDITDTKIREIAVRQSEERFRSLVQNGNDLIGILDAQGNFSFVSSNLKSHLGYDENLLIGRNGFEFIHPDDANYVAAALSGLEENESASIKPFRFKNSKGEWRWFESKVRNHTNDPLIGGIVVNTRDITERKQKEDESKQFLTMIEEQNQMMVEVLEQMRDGFITTSLDGKILYWNAKAEKIFGIPRENMLGKNFIDHHQGIESTIFSSLYKRLITDSAPIHEEVFSKYQQKWLDLHGYKTQKGISVFFRDITERKNTEMELNKLSLIAKETDNHVIIQDKDNIVLWVNNAFMKLTGYTQEECVGKHIGEICDGPDTDPETIRYVREKVARHEPYHVETLNYKKNGETFWSDVSCQLIFNEHGEIVQYFSIATDITERKRLEKQLEREQRDRQIKITAATLKAQEHERSVVSQELHDNVNQVLTTVKLYIEMCRDGFPNKEQFLDKSIKLLQDSINEIRSLSKRLSAPSLGKIKLSESVNELVAAIGSTNKFEIVLDTKGINALEVEQEVHLAIYRILQEHMTNVLKHAEASKVQINLDLISDFIRLIISDNGKGFDMKQKTAGIGITNMITRAESLNGTFMISSEPERGCNIEVRIPYNHVKTI
jgi:PAS domain S-box-containing protein